MRRGPTNYGWCPSCHGRRNMLYSNHGPDCGECGTELVDVPLWRRAITGIEVAIGACILLGVLLGPPAMAVYKLIQGQPLLVFETVTVTRTVPQGVLLTVFPWAVVLVLFWILNRLFRGGLPRP